MRFAEQVRTAQPGRTHLFFAGQAGFIFKSKAGTTLAVDLYLTDSCERLDDTGEFKRLSPKILAPTELILDYVVTTHPHWDHFDPDAVPLLLANGHTKLIASTDCREQHILRLRLSEEGVTYVKPGDEYEAGDIRLDIVPCDHGDGAPDAFGLVITIDGKKIYIAGDTCLRLDEAAEIAKLGPFDVVIGPVNGAFGNLTPSDFTELVGFLKPDLAIPCHFGTFVDHSSGTAEYWKLMRERLPERSTRIMAMGESLVLG